MCGIAGYISPEPHLPSVLQSMVDELVHRGPDSWGFIHDGMYHAGMRRLSINDPKGGDQPLYDESKDVAVIYNGEIYNSPRLRSQLEADGVRFRTGSDGEVICHLYNREGERLFERLDGMFAVALWDKRRQKLVLARDIPGEKPLYFARPSANELVFASELSSLTRYPNLDLSLNLQAVWDFPTFLWIPEPSTIYKNIHTLPSGHYLVADKYGVKLTRYKNLHNSQPPPISDREAIKETRRLVENAVESRLLSDVPIGSFLSSGLDSSIVTTIAAKKRPDLSTYTIGFEDLSDPYHGRADESPYVEEYAKKLKTRHRTIRVTAEDFRNDLETFTRYGDQPFAVSSGLGILSVARAARDDGVKVLLSGDGADEAFGGYSWYVFLRDANNIQYSPVRQRRLGSKAIGSTTMQYTGLSDDQIRDILGAYPPPRRAWAWHYYASEEDKRFIFNPDPFRKIGSSIRHFDAFKNPDSWTPEDFIRQDRLFYFPNEMLRKVDRMTMAMSVEGRVPFAAPAIQAFADGLNYDLMVRGGTLKWVLREAFKDLLPQEVIQRPKHGFNVPIDHWLKNEWSGMVDEAFSATSALSRLGLIHENSAARAKEMLHDPVQLNGHSIFCFIQLNRWLEQNTRVTV